LLLVLLHDDPQYFPLAYYNRLLETTTLLVIYTA
jgi:hypothetical protein